jgi:hypothetical protein
MWQVTWFIVAQPPLHEQLLECAVTE